MFNSLATAWFRLLGGVPCCRIYGKGRREKDWRIIDVFATSRRNDDSRWPSLLFRGTLITWTSSVISLGWDAAEQLLCEQASEPASRDHPVEVPGGRIQPLLRPPGSPATIPTISEVLAHECGHTWQARRLGWFYLPVGALFTFWREGKHFWNHFENQASAEGQFGGLVNGSVCPELMRCLQRHAEGG
jgi:hypothetical protein